VSKLSYIVLVIIFLPTTAVMLLAGVALQAVGSLFHTAADALAETAEDLSIWVGEYREQ
jgi:hypothetical protein